MASRGAVVFQEASKCFFCNASFGLMKRRHHCRSCGNSFCDTHSPKRGAVSGFDKGVRLCEACLKAATEAPAASTPAGSGSGAGRASREVEEAKRPATPPGPPSWCTCGMPLCICEAPAAAPAPAKKTPAKAAKPARGAGSGSGSTAAVASAPSSDHFTPFGFTRTSYETSADGLKEAIKNGDVSSVRRILAENPALAVHMDHSGQTMLHLAAMFNHTDIAKALVEAGADPTRKNCTDETVFDVAEEALKAWLQAHA